MPLGDYYLQVPVEHLTLSPIDLVQLNHIKYPELGGTHKDR